MTRLFSFGSCKRHGHTTRGAKLRHRPGEAPNAPAEAALRSALRSAVEELELRQLMTAVITPLGLPNNSSITVAAGQAVHVHGLQSTLPTGTEQIEAKYRWEFGDIFGRFNELEGFNAAHVYDEEGTYEVRLSIYDENGAFHDDQTLNVTVNAGLGNTADPERAIYVDAQQGNDAYDGGWEWPVKSFARATQLVRSTPYQHNTTVLFRRGAGQVYDVAQTMSVNYSNVRIGTWGAGANPVMRLAPGVSAFHSGTATNGLTVEDLVFDSADPAARGDGLSVRGNNVVVRNCEFRYVGTCVNTELGATGVLVQDNRAPLTDGVRGYLVWAEGSDHTYIGNSMANSTIEHCIRASKRTYADGTYSILNRVLVGHNGLRNPPLGGTDSKGGTVTFRDVRNAYIHGNSLYHGPIQIGDNNDPPTENVVVDGNTVEHEYKPTEGIGHIQVHAGARKVMIRNNVIKQVHGSLHPSIQLTGTSTGVTTNDVRVVHNTNITDSEGGAFITLSQPATNVQVLNNLNVALRPSNVLNVQVGHSDGTGTGMSSFSLIDGNVWAPRRGDQGSSDEPLAVVKVLTDYKTVAEWNGLSQVGTDHRTAVTLSSSLTPTTSAADVSARRPGSPFDWNRRLRPASNATAGAVQRYSESELISGPWADSTGTYTLVNSGEAVGKAAYSDRGYTYTSVPASIASFPFIRTANDDKNVTLSDFLYFDLGAPADVFVVYDSRATTLPTWLGDGSWADTGETVTISSGDTFRVFKKHYIGGTVVLGGNKAGGGSGAGNNYTVFIEAAPW